MHALATCDTCHAAGAIASVCAWTAVVFSPHSALCGNRAVSAAGNAASVFLVSSRRREPPMDIPPALPKIALLTYNLFIRPPGIKNNQSDFKVSLSFCFLAYVSAGRSIARVL